MRAGGYAMDPRTAKPGFTPGYDLVGVVESTGLMTESPSGSLSVFVFRFDICASIDQFLNHLS